jgi:hypothetical protein
LSRVSLATSLLNLLMLSIDGTIRSFPVSECRGLGLGCKGPHFSSALSLNRLRQLMQGKGSDPSISHYRHPRFERIHTLMSPFLAV